MLDSCLRKTAELSLMNKNVLFRALNRYMIHGITASKREPHVFIKRGDRSRNFTAYHKAGLGGDARLGE